MKINQKVILPDIKLPESIKKPEEKASEDKFIQSSGETPHRSLKEWISDNKTSESESNKKNLSGKKLAIAGAGVAGVIAGYVFGGAAGAGVMGAVAGYSMGYMNEAKGGINEVWKDHDINNPTKLTGWSYHTSEFGHQEPHYYTYTEQVSHTGHNSDGTTYTYYTTEQKTGVYYTYKHDGYYHNYNPQIDWQKVGDFKTPHLVNENLIGPFAGAGIGIAAGAAGGGIVEGISSALLGTTTTLSKLGTLSGGGVGIGAAVGTVIGAAAGYMAGKIQENKNVVITRTYPVPVTEEKYMGEIPSDWTQYDWTGFDFGPHHSPDSSPNGKTSVVKTAPVLNEEGKPVMTDKTETIESKKYTKVSGAAIGAAIGAAAGALASVAIQLI